MPYIHGKDISLDSLVGRCLSSLSFGSLFDGLPKPSRVLFFYHGKSQFAIVVAVVVVVVIAEVAYCSLFSVVSCFPVAFSRKGTQVNCCPLEMSVEICSASDLRNKI